MACEMRALIVHVHGFEADIEAFFKRFDQALDEVADDAALLWPNLEIIDVEAEE